MAQLTVFTGWIRRSHSGLQAKLSIALDPAVKRLDPILQLHNQGITDRHQAGECSAYRMVDSSLMGVQILTAASLWYLSHLSDSLQKSS
jgi:hypothetical protein